ncbi:MAG: sigma-70 family RNA polymerase sigma factor [Xanthomonadales bacterium]|nr:sigma-70 family RNA polymerase sigma factor [Gammaproteobacteria bacterium]MBT8054548.1 sigma-70 family RNA polymerase sigma factor [Gammaproteobacteria bacterium]NND57612.1 sigma-70 family RNA polymerase sigma factor [Xanthomonadales bacterium]NNK51336.1 sigma-70 family RNA polymerase sigma factor [Xanthomonadales bacterium]
MERDQIETELQRLHPETFGWALACCGRNRSEAEDVMQLAYVKVLEGRAEFDGRSSFRTWLFGVVRLTAAERRRRHAVRHRLLKLFFVRSLEADVPGPESAIDYSARSKKLVDGMTRLSRRQSEVLQLAFYHEMTIEQVAALLGMSIGSARTHYARGKQNLALMLRKAEQGTTGND